MNKFKYKIIYLSVLLAAIFLLSNCDRTVEVTFKGELRGKVVDQNGNIVSGDVTTDDILVLALGEKDTEAMRIRVLGDGTYTNTHLYEQSYVVNVIGAVISSEEFTADLNQGPVERNITVTPFLTIPPPELVGIPSANEVTVSYNITGNEGYEPEERIIYVSTVMYPSQSTGSGANWHTRRKTVEQDQGTVTIDGLESGTRYFVRVTARAEAITRWNLSDQIEFTTP